MEQTFFVEFLVLIKLQIKLLYITKDEIYFISSYKLNN